MSSSAQDKLIEARLTKDKLIVALDVPTAAEARALVAALRDAVGMFKIGSQLFTTAGPEIVKEIIESGARVFLVHARCLSRRRSRCGRTERHGVVQCSVGTLDAERRHGAWNDEGRVDCGCGRRRGGAVIRL